MKHPRIHLLLTIILISVHRGEGNLLATPQYFTERCIIIYDDEFWGIYQNHFLLVNFLTLKVFQSDRHAFEVNHFTETVVQILNSYDYFITTQIQEHTVSPDAAFDDYSHHETPHNRSAPVTSAHSFTSVDEKELLRLKMFTSDSIEGYVIIVWDVHTLHRSLDQDPHVVIPEARATYALFFMFTSPARCDDSLEAEVDSILRRFWTEFNVVNVIAQIVCSCDTTAIYIYRPFVKIDGSWGVLEKYGVGQVSKDFRLIANPLVDFNGFPLKVAMSVNEPTAVRTLPKLLRDTALYRGLNLSTSFAGHDGLILNTLAEYLNFEIALVETESSNGSTTGGMRSVISRRAVFSGNGVFFAHYQTEEIEFTVPYSADPICVVVPKALRVPVWKILLHCFSAVSWLMIVVTCVACVFFWYYLGPSRTVTQTWWQMFCYLMGISHKIVPSLGQQSFLTSCMLYNIVILGVIQGSFFTGFTTVTYYEDAHTLEEVDRMEMPIAAYIWYFITDDSDLIQRLKRKSVETEENIYDLVAYNRNMIAFASKPYLEFLSKFKYVDESGLPLLHIVEECVTTYSTAAVLAKGSAFLTVFNNVITRLQESGLTSKWYGDVVDSLVGEKMMSLGSRRQEDSKSFSLQEVRFAFYVLILGYSLAGVAVLGEIWFQPRLEFVL